MGQGGNVPSWCRRGQKVTCIKLGSWDQVAGDDEPRETRHPVLDGIYTIRLIDPCAPDDRVHVTFEECHPEDSYWLERFRPLISGSLHRDIEEHFKPLLDQPARTDAFVKIPHRGPVS